MRQPAQRRADLRAQLAANRTGARRLVELRERVGADGLRDAMAEAVDYAERRMRACLAELEDGVREARDVLEAADGDLELRLAATIEGDELIARLHRLGRPARRQPQLPARGHAQRLLVRRARAHRPRHPARRRRLAPDRRSMAPEGSLLNARSPAAVVAGNVETSSRVADLVLAAFGRALGQGTMNNLTLGNDDFAYYETLGGGQGACPDADGPERRARRDVEHAQHAGRGARARVPAAGGRVLPAARLGRRRARTAAATGSCARSRRCSDMRYSLLTERRRHAPPGADGGEPGARGRNLLDGEELPLEGVGQPAAPDSGCGSRHREAADMASESVGFIGLGIMGSRQAANLAKAGYELTVFNRTRERAEEWVAEHGGSVGGLARARSPSAPTS